jgi:prepilin-type N-terminal cleavage/methylation domain-containing protein
MPLDKILQTRRGFSLVEVVVAIGIFAIAVISVIGLLSPINQSVAEVKDGDDATRIVAIIQAELQRLGVTSVNGYIVAATPLYASRDGAKIGPDVSIAPWATNVPDLNASGSVETFEVNAQKFFEIRLRANANLLFTPATDGFLALNIELRWPAYTGEGAKLIGDAAEQQNVLIVPVAITR